MDGGESASAPAAYFEMALVTDGTFTCRSLPGRRLGPSRVLVPHAQQGGRAGKQPNASVNSLAANYAPSSSAAHAVNQHLFHFHSFSDHI